MKRVLNKVIVLMLFMLCATSFFSISAEAASKSQTKKYLVSKKWSNKVSDPVMAFSTKYTFTFKKNGTVVLKGWRNKDYGTYKITGKKTAKLTFKKIYIDFPGEGWTRVNGRKYTVTIKIDKKKNRFKAKFKNVTDSNVENGYYYGK